MKIQTPVWLKNFRRMLSTYTKDVEQLQEKLRFLQADNEYYRTILKQHTEVSVDMGLVDRDPSTVIVIGRYHNRDFIQAYHMRDSMFGNIVDYLKHLKKVGYGDINVLDCLPEVKASVLRNINRD